LKGLLMSDDDLKAKAIDLYDRFTHDGLPRREFMARMTALAGSVAAAEALIGGIAASPAAGAAPTSTGWRWTRARPSTPAWSITEPRPIPGKRRGSGLPC
jgi:carboxymethylenebutenolidase